MNSEYGLINAMSDLASASRNNTRSSDAIIRELRDIRAQMEIKNAASELENGIISKEEYVIRVNEINRNNTSLITKACKLLEEGVIGIGMLLDECFSSEENKEKASHAKTKVSNNRQWF